MRIRSVKPDFWQHEMHETLSEPACLFLLALRAYADDEGRYVLNFAQIKALCLTCRELSVPLPQAHAELVEHGLVTLYRAMVDGKEREMAQIANWKDEQVINRPLPSRLPGPLRTPSRESSLTPHGALTDDSRGIGLDRIGLDRIGEERREGLRARAGEGSNDPQFREPTLREVQRLAEERGIEPACAEKFYWAAKGMNWMERGDPMRDWPVGIVEKKRSLEALVVEHPANREGPHYREDCTAQDRKNLTALRQEIAALTRQLGEL